MFALARALQPEYKAIAASGVMLQVDCPDMAMGRHTRFSHLSDHEFTLIAQTNVDALNVALGDIDPAMVRVHVCWGNYPGPHHLDMDAATIWPQVSRMAAKYILIEGANPRHEHEWETFNPACLHRNQVLVPGVIACHGAHVEHPQLVRRHSV